MDDLDIRVAVDQAERETLERAGDLAHAVAAGEPRERLAELAACYLEQRAELATLQRALKLEVSG